MNWTAIWVTFKLASLTAGILLVVGLPIAYWLTFSKWRWKFIVESVVALPLVLPPTVLGFYILVAIGPHSPVGRFYSDVVGHPLPFTFEGLLLASILYSLPFAVQPLVAGFSAVDRGYVEASEGLGVSPWGTFWSVVLPLARGSLLTSTVLTFTHTVGEFGVVLMLGGNIPGATQTLSIALYDQVQEFNYAAANRTALVLVGFAIVALLTIYLLPGVSKVDGKRVDVVQ